MASAPPNRTTMTPAAQVAADAATSASATRRQRAQGQALAIVLSLRRAAAGDVAIPASPAPRAGVACPAPRCGRLYVAQLHWLSLPVVGFFCSQEEGSMDPSRFDTLARSLAMTGTRRRALPTILAGAFVLLGLADTEAKHKRHKHKKKPCIPICAGKTCGSDGCGGECGH